MSRKDKVAELLSQGLTTAQICERLGITNGAVQACIMKIRKDLGPQAC